MRQFFTKINCKLSFLCNSASVRWPPSLWLSPSPGVDSMTHVKLTGVDSMTHVKLPGMINDDVAWLAEMFSTTILLYRRSRLWSPGLWTQHRFSLVWRYFWASWQGFGSCHRELIVLGSDPCVELIYDWQAIIWQIQPVQACRLYSNTVLTGSNTRVIWSTKMLTFWNSHDILVLLWHFGKLIIKYTSWHFGTLTTFWNC